LVVHPGRGIINARSASNEQEDISTHQQPDTTDLDYSSNTCFEPKLIQEVRKRTFSHQPRQFSPSNEQLIEAGFSHCNNGNGDRAICIYCYLICHQWTPTDDPWEVHRKLSPNCPYVKSPLLRRQSSDIINNNDNTITTTAIHPEPHSAPQPTTIEDYVQSTYFNANGRNIIICPCCNESLRYFDSYEDTMIDHASQFPFCLYVKHLRGIQIYHQVHKCKRIQQGAFVDNQSDDKVLILFSISGHAGAEEHSRFYKMLSNVNRPTASGQILKLKNSTYSKLVNAALELPISQTLLDQKYSLPILRQCWEDQLRLKSRLNNKRDPTLDMNLFI
jgi:hypothetical protein